MQNIIFEIPMKKEDALGKNCMFHVTEEVNAYIVWFSVVKATSIDFVHQKTFKKNEKNKAILYAVSDAFGVDLS